MDKLKDFWIQHDHMLDVHMHISQKNSLSHDLYRGMPPWFNAFYAHFQKRSVTNMLQHCSLRENTQVLDVGCGTGRWSAMLSDLGMKPVGIDIGFNALRIAKTWRRDVPFCQSILPKLNFADNSFDIIVSVTVLQHLSYTDQILAINEFIRILHPGGFLIACEIVDVSDPAPHVFQRSQKDWISLFDTNGFKMVSYFPTEYLPYVKWFQFIREWFGKRRQSLSSDIDVSFVVGVLQRHLLLAWLVKIGIFISYPLEYMASWLLPNYMARQGCFLFQKE